VRSSCLLPYVRLRPFPAGMSTKFEARRPFGLVIGDSMPVCIGKRCLARERHHQRPPPTPGGVM
jgi:hypothetical protein